MDLVPMDVTPGNDIPTGWDGRPFGRVLVPVESLETCVNALSVAAQIGRTTGGPLRLVHVRIWDPPIPRSPGRFYPETSEAATTALHNALNYVWAGGVRASGVVLEAKRSCLAPAILSEAAQWETDVIVLASRRRRFPAIGIWDKATQRVVREAACPVLLVQRRPA